ncbi:MAG: sigma-54-dependent transcriptional regulator [Bdellovibrionota bacterium]
MEKIPTIAVVEDDEDIKELVTAFFRPKGYQVVPFTDARSLLKEAEKTEFPYDVILTDLMLPHLSGIDLTKKLRLMGNETPIILITAHKGSEKAIEAIEAGAYDFVVKPIHFPQLQVSVERALHFNRIRSENQALKTAVALKEGIGVDGIIGRSPGLLRAIDLAKRVADSSANVFVTGETGTGKEVIAKAIHYFGQRKKHPFIAINCSAIPENLLESELFGHAKGSFTGASDKKIGLFEEAGEGTLFLDEIGDLSLPLQAKLLRTLQERRIKRIGENQFRPVNARIISATHKDLRVEVKEKTFREDLFFRLNVIPIHLPPLRTRKEDILPLAEFFLKKFSAINGKKIEGFSKSALEYLLKNQWTGNVRELENSIERAVVLCEGGLLHSSDLVLDSMATSESPAAFDEASAVAQAETPLASSGSSSFYGLASMAEEELLTLDELTNRYLLFALNKNHGAKDKTARDLGIDRKTLYRRLQDMNRAKGAQPPPAPNETHFGTQPASTSFTQ